MDFSPWQEKMNEWRIIYLPRNKFRRDKITPSLRLWSKKEQYYNSDQVA